MSTITPRAWLKAAFVGCLLYNCVLPAQEIPQVPTHISDSRKLPRTGSKDDIDSIGNRKIGEGKAGNWYSLEQEVSMGRELSVEIDTRVKLIEDPTVTEYINRVGQNLVRNSDVKVPFTIKVIDSDEVNAFALPGGFFYVNSGLILAAQDEAELAGVMAHEIAHVAAHHAARQLTRSHWFDMASIPLIFVSGGIGAMVQQAIGLAMPLSMMKFSRGFEAEADYLGVEYLYKTGYDPQAFISFFERIQVQEKQKPGFMSKAFAGHPQTTDRIHKTQSEISTILPPRDFYVITTSEFQEVKLWLATIENRHNISHGESNRPTLRRPADADSGSDSENDSPRLERKKE